MSATKTRPPDEKVSEYHPAPREGHEKEYELFDQLMLRLSDLVIKDGSYVHYQPRRIFIHVRPSKIKDVVQQMLTEYDLWQFSTITGRDIGDNLQVLFHFFMNKLRIAITFRIILPRNKPEYSSITDIVPAAEFVENEIYELFGIVPLGHPNPRRMILPENWPKDEYPMRKDWSDPRGLMEQSRTTGPKFKEEL